MTAKSETLIEQLRPVIGNERVLSAIASVPREVFVPVDQREHAYANVALPIAAGQTISQPLVVARMLALLDLTPADRVLDVGTGSGYHAVLLAQLADHVYTVERHAELTEGARAVAAGLGATNITFLVGDGTAGWPEHAPYDAINVAASASSVPPELERQLAGHGRLVMPVGDGDQHLLRVRRVAGRLTQEYFEQVRFVPLVKGQP